jgi:uncharacterized protein YidB (DUF937 family)
MEKFSRDEERMSLDRVVDIDAAQAIRTSRSSERSLLRRNIILCYARMARLRSGPPRAFEKPEVFMGWLKDFFGPKTLSSTPAADQRVNAREAQKILDLISEYFASSGGLAGVVKSFEDKGFVSKVRSWVSTGPNQPINSVEALQLIGHQNLKKMAEKAGVSVDKLRDLLAEFLPIAIDKATPEGKPPVHG